MTIARQSIPQHHILFNLGLLNNMRLPKRLTRQAVRFAPAMLVALLATVLLAPTTRAQSVPVDVSDETTVQGDTVTVPIRVSQLDQVSDITAFGFEIDTDSTVLSYAGFDDANTLADEAGFTVDENREVPRVGGFGSTPLNDVAASGVLLRLKFAVVGSGGATATLTNFELNAGTPSADPAAPSFNVSVAENFVSFENVQASLGDTVLVPVTTTDLTGLDVTSYEFEMSYDTTVVEPVEGESIVTEGTLSSNFSADGNVISPGVLRVGAFGNNALQNAGTLVFVQLRVKATGTSPLGFVPNTFRFNNGSPVAATGGGSLTSSSSPPVAASDTFSVSEDGTLLASSGGGAVGHSADISARQSVANGGVNGGTSSGTGSARFLVNRDDTTIVSIDYSVIVEGLDFSAVTDAADSTAFSGDNVIGIHVHNALRGEQGGRVLNIVGSQEEVLNPDVTGDQDRTIEVQGDQVRISGTWDASDDGTDPNELASAILNTEEGADAPLYVNVHTSGNPGGEIRGQLVGDPIPGGVLENDTDADGDPLTASVETAPSNGSLTLNSDGSFTYIPLNDYSGTDSFTYTVSDDQAGTDQASVVIEVESTNDAPQFASVIQDTTAFTEQELTIAVPANAGDDGDVVSFSLADTTENAGIDEAGTFTFEPDADQRDSTYTFTVVATDTSGLAAAQSFDVNVQLGFTLGDPSQNGTVSAFDASLVLQAELGDTTFTAAQQAAADVSGNGEVSALDASQILRFVVGLIDTFDAAGGETASKNRIASSGQIEWGEFASVDGTTYLPIRLTGTVSNVFGLSVSLTGDTDVLALDQLQRSLPDGWQVRYRAIPDEGSAKIVMAGATAIQNPGEILRIPVTNGATSNPSLEATAVVNEKTPTSLGTASLSQAPDRFTLQGNFPNPFTERTAITFDAPANASVEVAVYDMLGRRVLSVTRQSVSAGQDRSVEVDGSALSSGVYVYRLKAETDGDGAWTKSGRMVVVK